MEEKNLKKSENNIVKDRVKTVMRDFGILPILIVVIIIFALMSPNFATFSNTMNILRATSINLVVAVGMTFVILTGGIDLSVGSTAALAAVVALKVSLTPSAILSVPTALLIGAGAGLINGLLVAYVGIPPFIATLGAMTYLRGASFLLANGVSIINSNLNFAWIGNGYLGPIPWLAVIALLAVFIGAWISKKTVYGMRIYAVGGNLEAAKYTGIKTKRILMSVYIISGLASALAGIMIASRMYSANGLIGQGYELDAIAAVIIGGTSFTGGKGTLVGTLFGAILMGVLNNWMTLMGISYYWQQVVRGSVIVIAVIVDTLRTKYSRS
ncbi:ribose ABC transporter permease [Petrotoga sp. 9PW.55.5.1]|uniref:ABC transporter permease subunit n=1 Tax=Petrotoga sp. 9PW.55.5.1 TaxID=1308979 RepID=UPI000DC48879|nr:ribose ABC transporter permease [Petrotoga sp. 9PW.55.5.1]RAO98637.1 ribose ABC transporter permease [Petrotoga sp. 9PW.55.5.1]